MKGHNCFMKVSESCTDSLSMSSVWSMCLDCVSYFAIPSTVGT